MKIGIITFHAPHNRGSMLQAYAMHSIITRLDSNNSVEIINFSNLRQRNMYALLRKVNSWKDFLLNCFKLVFYPKYKRYFNDFTKFSKRYLVISHDNLYLTTDLARLNGRYEYLIAGSDQIWNTQCYDADNAYFLGWSNCPHKIAYAPSFGANDLNLLENKSQYKEWINQFQSVSIRENNGKKWLKTLTGRNVDVVLDPTLLLPRKEWDNLANEEMNLPKQFIFFYSTGYPENVCKFVHKYAKECGLPVIITDIKHWVLKGWKYNFLLAKHGGPNAFLTLIKNATLVFTSSFHGTAFSIIFEKKFYYLDDGKRSASDDRALTLIEDMELIHRFKNVDTDSLSELFTPIDYNIVNERLKKRKEFSLSWLKKTLNCQQ
jgi:hypothetical protein